jgi:hypothetical protein
MAVAAAAAAHALLLVGADLKHKGLLWSRGSNGTGRCWSSRITTRQQQLLPLLLLPAAAWLLAAVVAELSAVMAL